MRSQHAECREKHVTATTKIPLFFAQWFDSPLPPARFHELAAEVARTHYVGGPKFQELTLSGFGALIDKALADHLLTEAEEEKVIGLLREFNLTVNDLPPEIGERFIKCAILRELAAGRAPERVNVTGDLPLNLGREEKIIWVFQDVTYFTTRSRTQYVGGSHGASIRVMKGVYYRVGAFKGEPVRTEYLSEEGNGSLTITNKAIYFYASPKFVKLNPKKIIAVETFSDGISITRDAANAKPQTFKLDDPWFAANVITKLDDL